MSTNLIPFEPVDDQFVNLLVVYNALNVSDRQVAKLTYARNKTLLDYMEGLPDPEMWSVCVNAEPYHLDDWAKVYPQPNDYLTLIPVPYGGGDGKSVLRMVAMIAVAIAAPYAAGMMMGVSAAAVGTTAGGMALTAGITVAGGMLVNALLPPPKPSANNRTDASESPTYGIEGSKNTQSQDVIVPLVYGEFRYHGNYVNVKTENRGSTQIIYAQAVVSEGEIESISDFLVQDQPISNYEDVSTVVRRGTDTQSIVGWFASSLSMINKNITLSPTWVEHNTVGEVDGFRVDVVFPTGLSNIDDKSGDRNNRSVNLDIQYRKIGSANWSSLFSHQHRELTTSRIPSNADHLRVHYQQTFSGDKARSVTGKLFVRNVGAPTWTLVETVKPYISMNTGYGYLSGVFSHPLYSGLEMEYKTEWSQASPTITATARYPLSPRVTARTSQPLRRSYQSGILPEGDYQIRVRRTNNQANSDYSYDKVVLSDVVEIVNERVRYNHTAFYGVRVRLTDQLGGLPKMSAKVKGIKVPHYDRAGRLIKRAWSANPAWITADMLTNRRYGAGLDLSRIDMPMFVEWAKFCDENKYYFNGIIDSFSNIWDACQMVLRVGHARFTTIGNIISLSIYRATEPVMMFGSGNIIEGSLSLSWQSLEDRSNEFEIEYFDKNNGNKQNSVRVVDEQSLARGDMQRISTTRMVGIDNQKQALHEAHFQKALNQALIMSGKFEASIEALACGVGDVVILQHDMPEWGESGRVKPGSTTTTVVVDRPLTIATDTNSSSLLVLHPAIKRADATVSIVSAASKTVFLTSTSTNIKAKRLKVGTLDLRIINIAMSGAYIEVVLEDTSGLTVNAAAELWDTDVIETRAIQSYNEETDTVTLAGPLSAVPEDFCNYMIGASNAEAKPVSIVSIDGDGDYKRTVSFIEYNETIFTPEKVEETPLYTDEVGPVQQVRDLIVQEELTIKSGSLITDLIVMWNGPADGNYAGAHVYMQRNEGSMYKVGTAYAGSTSFTTTAKVSEQITVKIVAYDGAGRAANYDNAPVWKHTVEGASAPPGQVADFKVEKGLGGIEFTWSSSREVDVTGYEIREGASWGSTEPLIENYAGNRFFTTKKKGGLYTYHIKAVDMLGMKSEQATTAVLMLPAPSIVVGFASVQNGDQLILQWRKNHEIDVVGYEIRQGSTWGNSKLVSHSSGTSLTVPAGATASESYLIKAYDSAGVESAGAARVNQSVTRSQVYNAVFGIDATALGYPGSLVGFVEVASKLEGATGEFFEYLQPIDMPNRYNATVVTQEIVGIKSTVARTWKDMNFPWYSSQASVPWFPTEESDDLSLDKQLTLYVGPTSIDQSAWTMRDASTTPLYGTGTMASVSAVAGIGRFGYGLIADPVAGTSIDVTTSGDIASWWVRYEGIGSQLGQANGSLGSAVIELSGGSLRLIGASTAAQATELALVAGRHYFVVTASVGGQVKAFVACLETGVMTEVTLDQDIGPLSGVKLA